VERLDEPPLSLLIPPREAGRDQPLMLGIRNAGFYIVFGEFRPEKVLGVPKLYNASWIYIEDEGLDGGLNVSCMSPVCTNNFIGLDSDRLLLGYYHININIIEFIDMENGAGDGVRELAQLLLLRFLALFNDTLLYEVVSAYPEIAVNEGLKLELDSIDGFVPGDQAWLESVWFRFNALFPVSYAMVMASIILLIVRVRRWQ